MTSDHTIFGVCILPVGGQIIRLAVAYVDHTKTKSGLSLDPSMFWPIIFFSETGYTTKQLSESFSVDKSVSGSGQC